MGFTDTTATATAIICRRTGRATHKGWQSGLGVKKCNEMRDTCNVRSARHPCEISRNAIPSYVAHGRCRRPIPLPGRCSVRWYITITTTVITAMASLSITVQLTPAVEEEWQVVSVTSGRIMVAGRRWHDGGIIRGPFCARPGIFFVRRRCTWSEDQHVCTRGWMVRGVRAGPRRNTITTRP